MLSTNQAMSAMGLCVIASVVAACTDVHPPTQEPPVVNVPPPLVIDQRPEQPMSADTSTAACLYGAAFTRHAYIGQLTPSRVEPGSGLVIAGGDVTPTCKQELRLKQVSLTLANTNAPWIFRNTQLRIGTTAVTNVNPTVTDHEITWIFNNEPIDETGIGMTINTGIREDAPLGNYTVFFSKLIVIDKRGKEIRIPNLGTGFSFEVTDDPSDQCKAEDCCSQFAGTIWDEVTKRCVRDPAYMDPNASGCGDNIVMYEREPNGSNGAYAPGDWAVWNFNLTGAMTEDLVVDRIDTVINGPAYWSTFEECRLIERDVPREVDVKLVTQMRMTYTATVGISRGTTRAMQVRCLVKSRPLPGLYTLSIQDVRAFGKKSACRIGSTGYFYDWVQIQESSDPCLRMQNGQTTKVWIDFFQEQRTNSPDNQTGVDAMAFQVHSCVNGVDWDGIGFYYQRTNGTIDLLRQDNRALFVNNRIAVGGAHVSQRGSWEMQSVTATTARLNMYNQGSIMTNLSQGSYVHSRLRMDIREVGGQPASATYAISFLSHAFRLNGRLLSNDEVYWRGSAFHYFTVAH